MQVTEAAKQFLGSLLDAHEADPRPFIRLSMVDDSYELTLDRAKKTTDLIFSHLGQPVLFVSLATAEALRNFTVDLGDDAHLIFRRSAPHDGDAANNQRVDQTTWQHYEHARLLKDVTDITQNIARLRAAGKGFGVVKELRSLEITRNAKWDEIRALWAGGNQ